MACNQATTHLSTRSLTCHDVIVSCLDVDVPCSAKILEADKTDDSHGRHQSRDSQHVLGGNWCHSDFYDTVSVCSFPSPRQFLLILNPPVPSACPCHSFPHELLWGMSVPPKPANIANCQCALAVTRKDLASDRPSGAAAIVESGMVTREGVGLALALLEEGIGRGSAAGAKGVLAGALTVGLLAGRLGPERLGAARQVSAVAAGAVDAEGEAGDVRDVDGDLVGAVLVLKGVLDQGLITEELALGHAEVAAVAEGEHVRVRAAVGQDAGAGERDGGQDGGEKVEGVDTVSGADGDTGLVHDGDGHGGGAHLSGLDLGGGWVKGGAVNVGHDGGIAFGTPAESGVRGGGQVKGGAGSLTANVGGSGSRRTVGGVEGIAASGMGSGS